MGGPGYVVSKNAIYPICVKSQKISKMMTFCPTHITRQPCKISKNVIEGKSCAPVRSFGRKNFMFIIWLLVEIERKFFKMVERSEKNFPWEFGQNNVIFEITHIWVGLKKKKKKKKSEKVMVIICLSPFLFGYQVISVYF